MNQLNDTPEKLMKMAADLFTELKPNPEGDQKFFTELCAEYAPHLDVTHQLKQFHAWCMDQHPTRITNVRFRFRGWLANTLKYQKTRHIRSVPRDF